jgi:serine phosphatase RsbU (regulator of sigma subunit)
VLGAVREAAYRCGRVRLEAGDTLAAYSDGVVESRGHGDEEFGLKRLTDAVRASNGASASQTLFSTLGTVLDFAGGRQLEDDLTLMVVRRCTRTGA